jgi:hypothetical protein
VWFASYLALANGHHPWQYSPASLSPTTLVLNATFLSGCDVVEAIVIQVEVAEMTVQYQYVKGHQDNKTPYKDLPFHAQLNVDADKLAGTYQLKHSSHCLIIPFFPTCPIALDILGRTIHQHMKSLIWDATHAGPLLQQMMLHNDWKPRVLDTINWHIPITHRLSTNFHRLHWSHFVKLCHGYLPAGKIAHPNNPCYPDLCPLCKQLAEDHQHILQCPNPTRDTFQLLLDKCDTLKTNPILKNILINGLSCWLKQIPFDETGIPTQYSKLMAKQCKLGWYQFFLAHISLQWAKQQDKYLKFRQNKLKGLSGPKWAKAMCTIITTQWIKLWDKHNSDQATQS